MTSPIRRKLPARLRPKHRRGVTMVESSLVLGVCMLLMLGMLDVGMAVLRYNAISDAARRVARQAIVRGNRSTAFSPWGPASFRASGDTLQPPGETLREVLPTIVPEEVELEIAWPDGGNAPQQRVHVTLRYQHQVIVPLPFLPATIPIFAESTMYIAH